MVVNLPLFVLQHNGMHKVKINWRMFEIKCPIFNQIHTGVSLFKSCNVLDFSLLWLSILILFFELP